jgi:methionyl aminopeptidase
MEKMEKTKVIKAGKIAAEVREFAKSFIKINMPLLEIAEKIENKIRELGAEPAFPVNLSINEIAAHYTPSYDDTTLAGGLLKVDIGVSVDGWIADTAFSMDLENHSENKRLIEVVNSALSNVIKIMRQGISTDEIGKEIYRTAISNNVNPIVNLTGHEIDRYDLHAGISIPNIDDKKNISLKPGIYAIEPFMTTGSGKVYDGKPSGIYMLLNSKNVRSPVAREVLTYISDEYGTLPFCSRWLIKEFGTKALLGLSQLEQQGNLHHFPQLIETSKRKVSQAEHTFLIDKDKVIVTTE